MKATALIKQLQDLVAEHGDLDVDYKDSIGTLVKVEEEREGNFRNLKPYKYFNLMESI
jgi:hypothetical protein